MKLDMLGHDDPSMIRMMEDLTGVDAKTIPLDDPGTRSIFITSEVLGYQDDPVLGPTGATAIPEFGTSFVRGMLEETTVNDFSSSEIYDHSGMSMNQFLKIREFLAKEELLR